MRLAEGIVIDKEKTFGTLYFSETGAEHGSDQSCRYPVCVSCQIFER